MVIHIDNPTGVRSRGATQDHVKPEHAGLTGGVYHHCSDSHAFCSIIITPTTKVIIITTGGATNELVAIQLHSKLSHSHK